ncbi:cellulose synthase complex periplasmic endoglucanase BcsZ [Edaphobacter aggregans]|uniref:cellulose synthase complex periplasmic endoglucanase BcsZ n=1 Tax=Edaphobacter aggregans TaxID=570835 RepID=UPI0005552ADF|nr:cellulose synthase complex periplasmic endoglucanase BcsZ [Edaphobacter aggregans]
MASERQNRSRRGRWLTTATLLLCFAFADLCRAQQPWPLWESYALAVLDPQGRVIDRSAQDRTTSEGQSYAMFFALVDNDRARFDKLLHWTEINLANGNLALQLPAWNWGKAPDGSWRVLDPHSASDADLWMSYSLLEAGRLWREPRYDRLGMAMAARIAQQEAAFVPRVGTTLLPGATGFHPDSETWVLNPSYLEPSVLAHLAKIMPNGPWAAILGSLDPILAQGSGVGFAMDWIEAGTTVRPALSPAQHASGDSAAVPLGSFDAIRVYLWLGIADPQTPGVKTMLHRIGGMAEYLKSHPLPPQQVDPQGRVLNPNAPSGFSAAVVPYLKALDMKHHANAQMDRLAATKDAATGLYGKTGNYYDQNLALFATGWIEGRYRFDREGKLRVKWK